MAIQYYMRAYNTSTLQYVDWVVNDQPDSTGQFAPGGSANLSNITVNRIVSSKVGNFLNPSAEPSFISPNYTNPADPYFLHLNSYDWLNPSPPNLSTAFPTPTQPIGVAVVRGAATASGPVNPYASLFWEEGLQQWRFRFINADGSVGSPESVDMGSLQITGPLNVIDGYISVSESTDAAYPTGDPPANSGIIRVPNDQFIKSQNSDRNQDVTLIGADNFTHANNVSQGYFQATNRVQVGDSTYSVYVPSYFTVDGYIFSGDYSLAAQSGFIRLPNNSTANAFKNSTATNPDLKGLASTSGNLITLGDSNNAGMQFLVGGSDSFNFISGGVDLFDIITNAGGGPSTNTYLSFGSTATLPTLTQASQTNSGQPLSIVAQSSTGAGNLGGPLALRSGHGLAADGYVGIGSIVQILPMMRVFPTSAMNYGNSPSDYRPYGTTFTVNNASTIHFNPVFRFPDYHQANTPSLPLSNLFGNGGNTGVAITGPTIAQDDAPAGNGLPMLISAQWVTGSGTTAGTVKVSGGSALGAGGSSIGGNHIVAGGNAPNGTINTGTLTTNGYGHSGGNVVLSPGVGSGSTGAQTHGEIDFMNSGFVRGRFYADAFSPFFEIGTASNPAQTGMIRLANFNTDTATPPNKTALAMRNISNTGDILLIGSDQDGYVVVGNGSSVIIGGNFLNNDINPAPTTTYIAGNLQVWGSTTIVDSTIVDIVGRVIHANWPLNPGSAPPALAPPTLITGFDVNRGYSSANVMNDGAAILWTEGTQVTTGSDGYWRFATIPQDGYNLNPRDSYTLSGLAAAGSNILNIMAGSLSVASSVNPAGGSLPVLGALRTQNNTTAVSARNQLGTADLLMLGSDVSNHIVMGASSSPQNAGFIFNTTTGSIFDYWINSVSQFQIGAADTDADNFAETLAITSAVTNPRLYQQTLSGTGANAGNNFKVNAQSGQLQTGSNANNNGGNLFLASGLAGTGGSGAGAHDGYVAILGGSTNIVQFYDYDIESDGFVEVMQINSALTNPRIFQADTTATTGNNLLVQAQKATGVNSLGGNLYLSSGFGNLVDGYVDLQVAGVSVVAVEPADTIGHSKFVYLQGRRRHVTQITGNYSVTPSDDLVAITTLTSSITVTLPSFPVLGDTYEIKDATGNAVTYPITISGNGTNIDANPTFILNQPYSAVVITYTGTTWSVT